MFTLQPPSGLNYANYLLLNLFLRQVHRCFPCSPYGFRLFLFENV